MTNDSARHMPGTIDEQLQAAERGSGVGSRISGSASAFGGRYAVLIGTLIALYLLVVVYIYPQHNPWLSTLTTVAFVAGIVGACRWYARRRRASSPGWSRRHSRAFGLTAALFAVGVALMDSVDSRDWWLWVPYAALVALPLAASALVRVPR